MWPWHSRYLNKCFKWHFYSSRRTTVPNYFEMYGEQLCQVIWTPNINVEVMAWTSSIYDHFIVWPSSMTLAFNLPEKMFQIALLLLKENNCAKLFWNPCINVEVMTDKLKLDHFIVWPSSVTQTFNLLEQMFQMAFYSYRRRTVPRYVEIHA